MWQCQETINVNAQQRGNSEQSRGAFLSLSMCLDVPTPSAPPPLTLVPKADSGPFK